MIVDLYAKTDIGRVRQGNEDNLLVLDLSSARSWAGTDGVRPPEELCRVKVGGEGIVLVVSDGMGGALAGDVASRMAVETVRDLLVESNADEANKRGKSNGEDATLIDRLRDATVYANLAIHHRGQEDARYAGMGATFTGAAITNGTLDLLQVGDSRAYVVRGSEIKQATKDQSLVQQLVDVGQISEEEAETHMFRNVILQALGAQGELAPVTVRVRVSQGDMLLLCSDGLSGKLRAEDMQIILEASGGDMIKACDKLIDEANSRGGEDNITVLLARFSGDDIPAPDSDPITVELPYMEDDTTFSGDEENATAQL